MKPSKAGNEQKSVKVSKASIPVNPDGINDSDELTVGQQSSIVCLDKVKLPRRDGNEVHIQFGEVEKRLDLGNGAFSSAT